LSATRTPTSSTLMYAGRSRAASSASSHLTLAASEAEQEANERKAKRLRGELPSDAGL
jgi:hypothetical protein